MVLPVRGQNTAYSAKKAHIPGFVTLDGQELAPDGANMKADDRVNEIGAKATLYYRRRGD